MCLGIPGKVVKIYNERNLRMGKVDFGGVQKSVCLSHTPEVVAGQHVIVHVGFALQVVDEEHARQVYEILADMDGLEELQEGEA